MRYWEVERRGQFIMQPKGDTHCGTGTNTFRYECKVRSTMLDLRGFVIDNEQIADMFSRVKTSAKSCEEVAEFIAGAIVTTLKNFSKFVTRIEVLVGPSQDAGARYVWEQEQQSSQAPTPKSSSRLS